MMFLDELRYLDELYIGFAILASLVSLWAMQKVTYDADIRTWLGRIKWLHRAAISLTSVCFLFSAAYTLYYETPPRVVDFLMIFVLLSVLILSVMRHMQAPVRREADQKSRFFVHQR